MRYERLIAASGFALSAALAPLSAQAADIVQTLKDSGQYSQFVDALDKAGLTKTLEGKGPYTVFAPTDEAFQKLQQSAQGQQQGAQGQQQQTAQNRQQSQNRQQTAQNQQGAQGQQQGGNGQILQQASSDQLKQILDHHIVKGKELSAQDLLGKQQKVKTMSGDQLTIDGTGTAVVLVPTGLAVSRVGDEVFVQREVAAVAHPAVTVSTTGQQASQSGQGQQQAAAQSGQQTQQSGQRSSQGQQQAAAQSGSQQGRGQRMNEQQGLLRAAMVVEPDIQADNGVIYGIDQVLVPQKMEQELMSSEAQSEAQQHQQG